MSDKTRGFVLTNFNADMSREDIINVCVKKDIRFIAWGAETCPTTGKPHLQMFCYFKTQKGTGSRSKKTIGSGWGPTHVHVEPMYGSFSQNERYCSKEGNLEKWGDEPKAGDRGDIKENVQLIASGQITPDELAMTDPAHFHQYARTYDRIEDIRFRSLTRNGAQDITVFWLYGPTGCGKSHSVFAENYYRNPEEWYIKPNGEKDAGWWDGYKGQKKVIINEFRGNIPFGELLALTDKWPAWVSRRGRSPMPFLATEIWITSSMPPDKVYKHVEDEGMDQIYRRATVQHIAYLGAPWVTRTWNDVIQERRAAAGLHDFHDNPEPLRGAQGVIMDP